MRKGGGKLLLLSSPEVTDDLSKACFGESDGGSRSQTEGDREGEVRKRRFAQKLGSKEEKQRWLKGKQALRRPVPEDPVPADPLWHPGHRQGCHPGFSARTGALILMCSPQVPPTQRQLDKYSMLLMTMSDDDESYRFLKMKKIFCLGD